jgi:hypothetical protein
MASRKRALTGFSYHLIYGSLCLLSAVAQGFHLR